MASKLELPGEFEDTKSYVLKGSTLKAWRKNLLADRVVAGVGITESVTPDGRFFSVSTARRGSAAGGVALLPFQVSILNSESGGGSCSIQPGFVLAIDPATDGTAMHYLEVSGGGSVTGSASTTVYCKVTTNREDLPVAAAFVFSGPSETSTHAQPDPPTTVPETAQPPGVDGEYFYKIADFGIDAAGQIYVANQYHVGVLVHRPGRNGRNGIRIFAHYNSAERGRITFVQGQIVSHGENTIAIES